MIRDTVTVITVVIVVAALATWVFVTATYDEGEWVAMTRVNGVAAFVNVNDDGSVVRLANLNAKEPYQVICRRHPLAFKAPLVIWYGTLAPQQIKTVYVTQRRLFRAVSVEVMRLSGQRLSLIHI